MGIIERLARAVDFFIDTNRFIFEIGGVENVHGGGGSACGWSYAGACDVGMYANGITRKVLVGLACVCDWGAWRRVFFLSHRPF